MALRHQSIAFYVLLSITVVAAVTFGVSGYLDTKNVVQNIYSQHSLLTRTIVENAPPTDRTSPLIVYAALESDMMVARDKRVSTALATRTWLRYSLTLIGLLLAIFGSAFVLGQISVPRTTASGSGGGFSISLSTTSPGLILAGLGILVIIMPTLFPQEISTTDAATYGTLSQGVFTAPSDVSAPTVAPANLTSDMARKRLGLK